MPMVEFFNNFNLLNGKQKRLLRESDIFSYLLLFLSSMFEYKGMSPDINTDFIEFYNILNPNGGCGVFKSGNKEVVGYITDGGMINEYGICEKFNINTLNTTHKEGVINGVNGAICWNNKLHKSDLVKISRYTEMFNLIDTAQKCLIRYARLFPVFEVNDDLVKTQIDKALKNADNGEPFTYVTRGLAKLDANGNPVNLNKIELGDYSAVDKIQYLSTYHNDLLRRFYSVYGMAYSQSMKQAQQSIEEVTSDRIVSWILPNDRLNERKKFIDTYNKVFNHNATVNYSEAWLKGYEKYMSDLDKEQITGGGTDERI